jgi:hypothetical protein
VSSDSNRRASPRIDARIKVQFRNGREFIACYSENLSRGGIFLQTEIPPDPNAILEVVLDIPNNVPSSNRQIVLRGRVIRLMSVVENSKATHKVAVQFVELTPQIQMQLDSLYEQILEAPRTDAKLSAE